jgi:hypothetical protein
MVKPNADRNKIILALKRAIVAKFDYAMWQELGYLTGSTGIITGHSRLLRSLHWRDDDYDGNVYDVLPQILGRDLENLKAVEDFVGLEGWLREREPALHAELYDGATVVSLEEIESAARRLDVAELNRQAARIRQSIPDDPALAIGSAKELLETVLKIAIDDETESAGKDIPALLRLAQRRLDLDPRAVTEAMPGAETLKRTLQNLGQIVIGVAEIRNLHGTGHGGVRSRELELAHARLVVNAAVTIATYLVEVTREVP